MFGIAVTGASGRLGQCVLKCLSGHDEWQLLGAFVSENSRYLESDINELLPDTGFDINFISIQSINTVLKAANMLIDFSLPSAMDNILDACVLNQCSLVSGVTGLNPQQVDHLQQAAKKIPILWSSNFSINIQMIKNLLNVLQQKNTIKSVGIIETHHQHKQDMPSGTAIALAQELTSDKTMRRLDKNSFQLGEVKITSVRTGVVAGKHHIQINLDGEKIILEHQAQTPMLFAEGALKAAAWLADQPAGLYGLNDFLLS